MNHDYSHCLDYKKGKCPIKKCFRAELTEDLRRHFYPLSTSWMHYKGTKECVLKEDENNA
jgi:hypothetical protein